MDRSGHKARRLRSRGGERGVRAAVPRRREGARPRSRAHQRRRRRHRARPPARRLGRAHHHAPRVRAPPSWQEARDRARPASAAGRVSRSSSKRSEARTWRQQEQLMSENGVIEQVAGGADRGRHHLRLELARAARLAVQAQDLVLRRDAARRRAVSVGGRPEDRGQAQDPAPDERRGHRPRRHRPAGRRPARAGGRARAGARDPRRQARASRPPAPRAPTSTTSAPSSRSSQKLGMPDRGAWRSSARRRSACTPRTGTSTSCSSGRRRRSTSRSRTGCPCTYVTEDTTRSRPEVLAALFRNAIEHGAHPAVHLRHRRPRHARRHQEPDAAGRATSSSRWASRSASTGTVTTTAASA